MKALVTQTQRKSFFFCVLCGSKGAFEPAYDKAFTLRSVPLVDKWMPVNSTLKTGARVALALRNDGMALEYAHPGLQTRVEIVAMAVQQNGLTLQFAPAGLRSDKPLVTLALHNNGQALRFAAPSLWDDPDIIAAAVASIGPVAVENIRLDIAAGMQNNAAKS